MTKILHSPAMENIFLEDYLVLKRELWFPGSNFNIYPTNIFGLSVGLLYLGVLNLVTQNKSEFKCVLLNTFFKRKGMGERNLNKLAKPGDAIAISNLKLSMTDSVTH